MTPSRQCKRADLPVRWPALLVLWLCSQAAPALAVTLGDEAILSLLGDPVEVEIDVLQWEDIDLARVEIALATPTEYENFDLSWLPVLEQLNFNLVGPDIEGKVKVLVSTREPVAEPYLELLMVLRWPGGSLLREYVLLFDLPQSPARGVSRAVVTGPAEAATFVPTQEPPVVQRMEAVSADAAVESELVTESEPEPVSQLEPATAAEPAAAAEPATTEEVPEPRNQGAIVVEAAGPEVQPEAPATGRRVYQVREGDGLWSIAQQFQPAGVGENIYQMLLSLHDLNRAAFINGNISLLKANALLQIPDADDITAIAATSAEERFEQRWAEGTTRLQTALRGDPLPAFSDLYEGDNVEAGPQAALETRAPGEETGRINPGGAGLLLPATTPVVVSLSEAVATADAGDLRIGEQGLQGALASVSAADAAAPIAVQEPAAPGTTVNPYLERINASTRDLQSLLQNRSLQIASLEEQLVEMRQRMQDAQQVTARLNEALEQALARRNAESAVTARSTTVLGLVALVLLVALLVAMVMLLKLTAQLRSQRALLWDDVPAPEAADEAPGVAGDRPIQAASAFVRQGNDTGIIVEEAGVSVAEEDEGLQQELLEIIGPAIRDEPLRQDHGKNGA